jgi:hypothetical protein
LSYGLQLPLCKYLIVVFIRSRSLIWQGEFWMGDHVVVNVDGLTNAKDDGVAEKPSEAVTAPSVAVSTVVDLAEEDGREDEPLIQAAECRICQEEDSIKNLEKPCTCNGSLKVRILFPSYLQILHLLLMNISARHSVL